MASTATTKAILCEDGAPCRFTIDTLRTWRKQHVAALAKNPPDRARYEHAIANVEQAMAEWKAQNPDADDPFDNAAWSGRHGKNLTPPEWTARQLEQESTRPNRGNVIELDPYRDPEGLIAALQRDGLDRERAEWMLKFQRGGFLDGLPEHAEIFCQEFERRRAAAEAERLFPRANGGELERAGAWDTRAGTSATGALAQPDEQPTKITATPFLFRNPNLIPPRDFLYDDHIIRRYVSGVVSMGGVGKTSEVQAEVAAMVTGRSLLGIKPKRPYRVWYINLEDPRDEIERRMAAIFQYYDITEQDIGNRLFTDSGRDTNFVIARDSRNGIEFDQTVLVSISETIKVNEIDLVVVDPFVNCARFAENDNNKMAAIIEAWAQIAEQKNCAVVLVHHVRKGSAGHDGFTIEDARGAIAPINSCRSVRVLNVMSKDEGKKAGGIERHRSYFRIDSGKANLAPAPEESQWRKIVSVNLGNATDDCPADRIGVVTPWEWPDPLATITADDVRAAQKAVSEGGPWRENSQAKNWVGKPIAAALGLDLDNEADMVKIKAAVKHWRSNGTLKEVEDRDSTTRKKKTFITAGAAVDDRTVDRMKPSSRNSFRAVNVGIAPAGVGCVLCQIMDERPVLKIKDGRVVGGKAECLHEGCAEKWFKGDFLA